ncbi:MAG: hypothetical protein Q8O40_18060, partial [Chloroflexota bacterium]|nr:hypothetical protein [Chloroflexota bacterium]
AIADDYKVFKMSLESALSSKIEAVRILPLYGSPLVFSTLSEARIALGNLAITALGDVVFVKFEVQVRFANGDKVEGSFQDKEAALRFLNALS